MAINDDFRSNHLTNSSTGPALDQSHSGPVPTASRMLQGNTDFRQTSRTSSEPTYNLQDQIVIDRMSLTATHEYQTYERMLMNQINRLMREALKITEDPFLPCYGKCIQVLDVRGLQRDPIWLLHLPKKESNYMHFHTPESPELENSILYRVDEHLYRLSSAPNAYEAIYDAAEIYKPKSRSVLGLAEQVLMLSVVLTEKDINSEYFEITPAMYERLSDLMPALKFVDHSGIQMLDIGPNKPRLLYGQSSDCVYLFAGWRKFVEQHNLKAGDHVLFYKVHGYRLLMRLRKCYLKFI